MSDNEAAALRRVVVAALAAQMARAPRPFEWADALRSGLGPFDPADPALDIVEQIEAAAIARLPEAACRPAGL